MHRVVLLSTLLVVLLSGRRSGSSDLYAPDTLSDGGPAALTPLEAASAGDFPPLEGAFDLGEPLEEGGEVDDSAEPDLGEVTIDEGYEDAEGYEYEYEYADEDFGGDELSGEFSFEWDEADDEGHVPWDAEPDADLVPSPALAPELVVEDAELHALGRIPGEFERQDALLLGTGELVWAAPDILAGIVSAVRQRIRVVALYDRDETRTDVLEVLRRNDLPAESVAFLSVPHDTMWVRDYGPLGRVRGDGSLSFLDMLYSEAGRFSDDDLPAHLSNSLGVLHADVPLRLDGGNLITNGAGLCLTTSIVLEENGMEEAAVVDILDEYLGCEQTLVLEPIDGEDTGHVDMFAVFTSADTVVVGRYDEEDDEENCALLDRNAERLAEVRVRGAAPLRVVRLPMPPAGDGVWRTYTNVVFANGCLLVPTYSDDRPPDEQEAFSTYQRLLPAWEIRGVDASVIVGSGGALHCVTRNVFSLGAGEGALEIPPETAPWPGSIAPYSDPADGDRIEETAASPVLPYGGR